MPSRRPRHVAPLLVALLGGPLVLAGCGPEMVDGTIEPFTTSGGEVVAQERCAGDGFECVTLTVPSDHFAAASREWEVTFAVREADGESRGILVTATGGPGSSGILLAESYVAALDPAITDSYDLVFFDQRGIGRSEPFACDDAIAGFDPFIDASADEEERDRYARRAEDFGARCFEEAGFSPAEAPLFATRQAVEDLETFREWYGAEQLTLYGESYGTQFQQAYAAAHPDRVQSLVLDGVVDPQTPIRSFVAESARAYSDVLAATLAGCDADPACAADAPGRSAAAYDELAAELAEAPRAYDYPLPDGGSEERELTIEELESAAAGSMSAPHQRLRLARAVNAAVEGDELPLARLAAAGAGADPNTGEVAPDPTFSPALFLAVECQDYPFVPEGSSPRAELDSWLDGAAEAGIGDLRLGDVYYADLPCLFWPRGEKPAPAPPAPADPAHPVLLLTADTDPNTPAANALRVHARDPDSALVVLPGGPHVLFGWGYPCVDRAVLRLLESGRLPARPETTCDDLVAGTYTALPPEDAAGYDDPYETLDLLLTEVLGPTFETWPGGAPLALGCPEGGTAEYRLDLSGTVEVELDGCAWTPDVPVDGTVEVADAGLGDATMTVTLPFAELELRASGRLTGTFRGQEVD
ncbi:alpha/beta hydrolase [Blastococcus sp. TF02A_35]|uniref:alpha/beta fold hydrolase n=1 Tax=Blastococcus sp. TF02A-35 TaxID=2559612 RepID=UPI001073B61F|nr:alpha/beta hydrolase [Blastococcus sp. TF02A_35]TFV52019.1 alpha/beta fold hydrolase [Blastococcus sp. TF02A_35]